MGNKGSCELGRPSWAINLGILIWLIFLSQTSYAIIPLENRQRQKALQEIYECYKKSFPEVPEVSPAEAMELLQAGGVVFVDVRPWVERCVSKLPESITRDEFLECVDRYRGKTVIAYDTVGLRSGLFADKLRKKSIGIANLKGGLLGWLHAGGKIYDRQCRETRRVHIYGCIWNYAPIEYESIR